VPGPVRRKEIRKENGGGMRKLGIHTLLDRCVQQMLLQAMTPIWEPRCSDHSYGFRPGRKAADAVRAAPRYSETGKDWVVDLDITKFFDHGRYLRAGAIVEGVAAETAGSTKRSQTGIHRQTSAQPGPAHGRAHLAARHTGM
jgi:hypothetical protein